MQVFFVREGSHDSGIFNLPSSLLVNTPIRYKMDYKSDEKINTYTPGFYLDLERVRGLASDSIKLWEELLSGNINLKHPFWAGLTKMLQQRGHLFLNNQQTAWWCQGCKNKWFTYIIGKIHSIGMEGHLERVWCARCQKDALAIHNAQDCKQCCIAYFYCNMELSEGITLDCDETSDEEEDE